MNGIMNENSLPTKIIAIFIRIMMPVITIVLLLIISPNMNRKVFGSEEADFVIRLFLCIMFCIGYFYMPFISKSFWHYTFPDFKKSNLVIDPNSILVSIFSILARFFVFGGITLYTIDTFLPVSKVVSILVSSINGLIFALPALAQYLYIKPKTE